MQSSSRLPGRPLRALRTALAALLASGLALACQRGVERAPNDAPAPIVEEKAGLVATTAPPRLVVLLVIDQLPSWAFERDRALFADRRGGFGRLLAEGTHYARAVYPYAVTYTAPGHATIGTGTTPEIHGILANNWYSAAAGKEQPAEIDPASPVFAVGGDAPGILSTVTGASGAPLRVEGIADMLRRDRFGAARSVSISGKARAAALMAGRRPDIAVWYEPKTLAMTTSRAYADSLPAWLADLARQHPIASYLDAVWSPRDRALLARVTGIPDDGPGEGSEYEMGIHFPYAAARSTDPARALYATPFLDEIEVDTALAAVDAVGLGTDDVPDLLAVSFSAHDYAGHNWGQESWEMLDLNLRLDDQIGRLLDGLDRRIGADRYAVVLTSDHGAIRLAEHVNAAGGNAVRIAPETLVAAAEAAATSKLGPGHWIASYSASSLYPSADFLAAPAEAREAALDAIVSALRAIDGIGYVTRTDRVTGECDRRDGMDLLVCRSLCPGISGIVFIAPREGSLVTTYPTGTSHESPTLDDREVPVIVRVPGRPARRVEAPISALQVAPTVTRLLGVSAPPAATAAPLVP
jgi:predicted AlkP superfamily pyrophosphatase or phosphodiesterase